MKTEQYLAGSAFVGNFSDPFAQQPHDGYEYATIIASMVSPTSRGNVTICSADTVDLPVVNPNWLATDTDQKVAVAAYKRIRAAFQSNAMAPVILGPEYFPGPSVQTDAEILETIRNTVMTIYHTACTCKMGLANDSMAVVDNHARVFGVQGLRVVDASAFPILPPGHPQSTVCKFLFRSSHICRLLILSQTCWPRRSLPILQHLDYFLDFMAYADARRRKS